jgi:hypothetical protein
MTMTRLKALLLITCAVALASCQSNSNVRSDTAPGVNFADFHTWGFYSPLNTDASGVSSITTQHLKNSVTREMNRAGFTYSEQNPDLLVNFGVSTRNRTTTAPSTNVGVGYHRRSSSGMGMGMSMNTNNVNTRTVTDGALTIDIVDRARNEQVWTGSTSGELPRNSSSNAGVIDSAVTSIFRQFPAPRR